MKAIFKVYLVLSLFFLPLKLIAGNIEMGKEAVKKYACASCHGEDLNNPILPSYPKLAGQHADYLEHALIAYQRGPKGSNSRGNAVMVGIAQQLSKQDISNISSYISSLKGTLVSEK